MLKINVAAVGKVKESYFAEGIKEYAKRLSRFCDFKIEEAAEENYTKADAGTIKKIKEREAERLKPLLKGYVVATAIDGKKFSSKEFADFLEKLSSEGKSEITFAIGGSYGLDGKVINSADTKISFSDMTFPHTMFRLILCEQLYRAFSINSGTAYHK